MADMKIDVIRVPQYSSKRVNAIFANGDLICTCRGDKTTQVIIAKLNGYDVKIEDGAVARAIEKALKKGRE